MEVKEIKFPTGEIYEGEVVNNVPHGKGIYKTESQIASTEGIQESEDSLNSSLLLLQMGSGLLNANKPKLRCRKTLSGTVSCF